MNAPQISPSAPLAQFLARLGITPLDVDNNELHYRLAFALKDAGATSHTERLVLVRGVLSAAHEDAALAVGAARAKYETTLKTVKADLVTEGKSVAAATVIAEGQAQTHRNDMHAAEAHWRAVKEYLRTVDKDFDRARSDQADARQGNHVGTHGGGLQ